MINPRFYFFSNYVLHTLAATAKISLTLSDGDTVNARRSAAWL
jgi:hypothetical protein